MAKKKELLEIKKSKKKGSHVLVEYVTVGQKGRTVVMTKVLGTILELKKVVKIIKNL